MTTTTTDVEVLYLQEPWGLIHLHDQLDDVDFLSAVGDLPFGLRIIIDDGGTDDPDGDFSFSEDVEDVLTHLRHVLTHMSELAELTCRPGLPNLVALRVTRGLPGGFDAVSWSYAVQNRSGGGWCSLREDQCDGCHPELPEGLSR